VSPADLRPSSTPAPRVQLHAEAQSFLAAADPLLRSDPFSTNAAAVSAARIAAGQEPERDTYLWATVSDGDARVIGAAMHRPPHYLFLSRMPAEAAAALASALAAARRAVTGVDGAIEATRSFATAWLAVTGLDSTQVTATRLYRLGTLLPPQGVAGRGITAATAEDIDLLATWLAAFHDEAQPDAPILDWRSVAERRIRARQVHYWQVEGVVVAMAAVSAPANGVAPVGRVYTPPAHRRRGYGAAVTAHATATALASGAAHVVLYTDLANPISNSIYQKIGFVPDHDAEERAFIDKGDYR
jgi:predicted GNAT family acetyltransferase